MPAPFCANTRLGTCTYGPEQHKFEGISANTANKAMYVDIVFMTDSSLRRVAEVKHDPVVLAKRAALAAIVLFIHTALIAAAIATVYGTEKWIHFLWSDTDLLLFDRVPYRFLFQAIDCVFIALFGSMGVRDAFHILKGEK